MTSPRELDGAQTTQQSDLEMTKLCAQAMGYEILDTFADVQPPMREIDVNVPVLATDGTVGWHVRQRFAPLRIDKQALALVKHLKLAVMPSAEGWAAHNIQEDIEASSFGASTDLNRAIVQCVARMQGSKP